MLPMVTEDEVVGSEQLTEGSGAHAVHGPWFQVHQHSPGDVFMSCTSKQGTGLLVLLGLVLVQVFRRAGGAPTGRLVVVNVDPVQLQ